MTLQFDSSFFTDLWSKTMIMMKERMSAQSFATWFTETKISDYDTNNNTIYVYVPFQFTSQFLTDHYTHIIENAFIALTEHNFCVKFISSTETDSDVTETPIQQVVINVPKELLSNAALNPRYTFDSFVIGASNRFAHAACLAVAESPAKSYNPLFIYGGVGLGKTHLMHAIGNHVLQTNAQLRVLYLTSERFTNEYIKSIMNNNPNDFRNLYRTIDVLLIDDIQFLAKKEGIQEEFFHTFNALHEAGKQIIISSDRTPREIPTLEDRLRSRFEWGLITDVQSPDLETRIAILQRKAKSDGLQVPDDVCNFIANQINSNIRELEGALIRVIAFSSLVNADLSVSLAEQALKDILSMDKPRIITVNQIQKVIGDHYGLKLDDFKARRRTKDIVFPRQIAMYLTRELTDLSLPRIGDAFGGRDHTTVLHACDKISGELRKDSQFRATIDRLSEAIKSFS